MRLRDGKDFRKELWARAAQDIPGGKKGSADMEKNAIKRIIPFALVIVGWVSFLLGNCFELPFIVKLPLLTVARVLPKAL